MNDKEFADQARGLLDDSAQDLDELTRARLRGARLRALDAIPARRRLAWPWLGAACASVAVLAVTMVLQPESPSQPVTVAAHEAALAGEELEMLSELDFLLWLAEHEATL